MNGLVQAPFGDGIQRFRLTIGGAEELEQRCNAGVAVIAQRLTAGTFFVRDVRELLRLGLVGGGKSDTEALVMVERYASVGLEHHRNLALAVLMPLLFGEPDDPPKKSPAGRKNRRAAPAPTAAPLSEPTTAPGP